MMSNHNIYRMFLVEDETLREQAIEGQAKEDDLLAAFENSTLAFEFKSEISIDAGVVDGVTRVNWTDVKEWSEGHYRLANPDDCEGGATRLADLLMEPRKLARVLARLYGESEIELLDEDTHLLSEFIQENDVEVDIHPESVVEGLGLFITQLSASLQASADHDAWLLVSAQPGIE